MILMTEKRHAIFVCTIFILTFYRCFEICYRHCISTVVIFLQRCLLDWVNPGCLGSLEEFTEHFALPIKHGQTFEATKRQLATARKSEGTSGIYLFLSGIYASYHEEP